MNSPRQQNQPSAPAQPGAPKSSPPASRGSSAQTGFPSAGTQPAPKQPIPPAASIESSQHQPGPTHCGPGEARPQGSGSADVGATARDFTSAAASLSSDLQHAAKSTTRAVKEQASEFAADVGHELSNAAERQKIQGAEAIQGFARAIESAAHELERQSPAVAGFARDAAKQVDAFSGNIRGRSVTELMQAASDLARSQPVLFMAGATAAGFAFARFLKSSAPPADSSTASQPQHAGTGLAAPAARDWRRGA